MTHQANGVLRGMAISFRFWQYIDRFAELSVLNQGSGEGAMALAFWQRGVRIILPVSRYA